MKRSDSVWRINRAIAFVQFGFSLGLTDVHILLLIFGHRSNYIYVSARDFSGALVELFILNSQSTDPSLTPLWEYDNKGQVVTADHSINAKDRSYAFDGIGNRTSRTDNTGTVSSTPNALNQLGSVNGTPRLHDSDGNLEDDGTKLYAWDAENRLVMVQRKSDNAVISEYRYDYMSRRVYKETTAIAPQGIGVTLFHYEGWNLCAEYTATAISGTAPNITPSTITTLQRTYTWGMDLSGSMQRAGGVGGLLMVTEHAASSSSHYYPTYDGNGNISEYLDSTGASAAHYEYDAFGKTVSSSGTKVADFAHRFSTKYLDDETGLYYYGYRYYDPTTGRWPSRDPIQERGGTNLYGFVENDSVNRWDILGNLSGNPRPISHFCDAKLKFKCVSKKKGEKPCCDGVILSGEGMGSAIGDRELAEKRAYRNARDDAGKCGEECWQHLVNEVMDCGDIPVPGE